MNRKQIEDIMKIVDDIATARVQRFVVQYQCPNDDLRHKAVDQRVKLQRNKLREQLERL
jgi:hypothetical protein